MKLRNQLFRLVVLTVIITVSLFYIIPQTSSQAGEIEQELLEKLNNKKEQDQSVRILVKVASNNNGWKNRPLVANKLSALRNSRQSDQAEISAFLEKRQLSGDVSIFKAYTVFNGFAVSASKDLIRELAARPDVEYVQIDRLYAPPEVAPMVFGPELTWEIEKSSGK